VSGPAKAEPVFGNTAESKRTVTFPAKGEYVLEMSADNTYGKGSDRVIYIVGGVVVGGFTGGKN
jgi:hypothetical protein